MTYDAYDVSSVQRRLFLVQQMHGDSVSYNIPFAWIIEGNLDSAKLEEAVKRLIELHETFRTSFVSKDNDILQVIHHQLDFELEYIVPEDAENIDIGRLIHEFSRSFDLSQAPLWQMKLVQLESRKQLLFFDIHHIIFDGFSASVFLRDLVTLYNGGEVEEPEFQYVDFTAWQNEQLDGELIKLQEGFWLNELGGELPRLELPTDYPRTRQIDTQGDVLLFELGDDLSKQLQEFAQQEKATLYTLFLTAFNVFLALYSRQEELVIGSVIHGRTHKEFEDIIGMFVNTLVMRNFPRSHMSFGEFLQEVSQNTLNALEHQDYPFEMLVDKLAPQRDINRNPLFDVMFSLQNISSGMKLASQDNREIDIKLHYYRNKIAKFDLTMAVYEYETGIKVEIEYRTSLFREETIRRMGNHFVNLLRAIVENPRLNLMEIPIMSPNEKEEVLYAFNRTDTPYPREKTIHGLFKERAALTPHHTALVTDTHTSYLELDRLSGNLASYLIREGVQPGSIVAIKTGPSLEMVTGLLGILKAGAAYMPIDPGYPQERIDYMMSDSGSSILLTEEDIARACETSDPIPNPGVESSDNLCYVIYTSGSTGHPKGVMVEHRSAVNVTSWFARTYRVNNGTHLLKMSQFTFDASINQIFGTLLHGGVLHIIKKEMLGDFHALRNYIARHQVQVINFVPQFLDQLLGYHHTLPSLQTVICGAEYLPEPVIKRLTRHGYSVYNHYGPTETTIDVLGWHCSPGPSLLGKPISNMKCYINDPQGNPVPVGVPGELWVGGDGVARGYLNNPELTAQCFINHSKFITQNSKLYKTGDLVRWLPDGSVQFLGRIDHQVKIRGFRIEPGEIESRILKIPGIENVIVIAHQHENSEKSLCGYFSSSQKIDTAHIREHLTRDLPEYMVPAYLIQLDRLPLTPGGKIDRRALPDPVCRTTDDYIAPSGDIEMRLAAIWSEVLDIHADTISAGASFFRLGGHSLKATIMAAKIHQAFEVKIALADIFAGPTIREMARHIRNAAAESFTALEIAPKQEYYPLSSAQKRLFVLREFDDKNNIAYNMPMMVHLEQDIDRQRLEETFKKLIQRHESLRTSFKLSDDRPVQQINENVDFSIEYDEAIYQSHRLEDLLTQFVRPFDLSLPPLLRVKLLEIPGNKFVLFLDMHHIITDGTSQMILTRDFNALYNGETLPPLRLQYKDYSQWENSSSRQEILNRQAEYWTREFYGELPVLQLPADNPRPLQQSFAGSTVDLLLTEKETRILKNITRDYDLSLYMSVLALVNILLSKLSGQEDIVVGTPAAARRHSDLQGIVGMFVNTLAMRNFPACEKTLSQFLLEVRERTLEAFENQEYPFEELVDRLSIHRDTGRNPVFDVMLNLLNLDDYGGDIPDVGSDGLSAHRTGTSKFDLNISVVEMEPRFLLDFEYSTALFTPTTIERFIRYFRNLVIQLDNPGNREKRLCDLQVMIAEEKEQVLKLSNGVQETCESGQTIHLLFEDRVSSMPNDTALVFNGQSISYDQLNRKANQLAVTLREKGVGRDSVVALMAERSFEMVTGMLAILKAGGAYLPVDPEYPQDRICYMLLDSGAKMVLTNSHDRERLNCIPQDIPIIQLQYESNYIGDGQNLEHINDDHDLLYIIYTSGSTGIPKGVMLEHRNLVNLMHYQYGHTDIDFSRVLQFTTISFDVSFQEIFSTLLAGGELYLIDRDTRNNVVELFNVVRKNEIKTLFFPASFLKFVMNEAEFSSILPECVEHIVTAGEQVIVTQRFKEYLISGSIKLHNHYGPSETHVVTALTLEPDENIPELPSIGRPVLNTGIYLLDKGGQPVPRGVPGELFIGGVQVGRGYLNRPSLTQERFADTLHGRLYRTGDLARWLPDSNLQFLGRIDHQVKIRGFRVELGEIEHCLLNHPEVKETVVLARQTHTGEIYLCAYIVGEIGGLREYLNGLLPDYMVPAYFVPLETIPLTPNKKIDRRALPEPDFASDESEYVAPGNETENQLVEIWSDILQLPREKIGVTANFFELGGHSLKAIILSSRIHKALNVKISLGDIFNNPTIRELGQVIGKSETDIYAGIIPVEEQDYYLVSSAQKRLYFLDQFESIGTSYNMPIALTVHGRLDPHRLENAFRSLIQRHETLRTSFHKIDGQYYQKIHDTVDFSMEYPEAGGPGAGDSAETIIRHFVRSFDLSQPPLLRVGLVPLKNEEHLLLFDMHHIVSDGTSMAVLVNDITRLYDEEHLEPLPVQYKDFAMWQNRLYETGGISQQEEYWLNLYHDAATGEIPRLNLPTDFKRPEVFSFEGGQYIFKMEDAPTFAQLARENGATLYMNLLAAFNVLLYRYSGQEDIIVGTGIAGRPHVDLQNMVGMFINSLAMRNQPTGDKTYGQFLNQVKENSIRAFECQDVQFEELVDRLNLERDPSHNPLFDVAMVVQNFQIPEIAIKDLTFREYEFENTTAKFDLTLYAYEGERRVGFVIAYCKKLFTLRTITQMGDHLNRIIRQVIQNPGINISDIQLLDEKEKEELLIRFNQTQSDYPIEKTIHALFQEQVSRTPENIAVVSNGESLTYVQLEQTANRVANYLHHEKQLRPEERVGLLLEPSQRRVEAIFGVLKAGGAYVPIDPGLPEERIKTMLVNAEIRVVISEKRFLRTLNRLQWECPLFHSFICLDTFDIASEEESEESELMDEKLWRYVGETATDDITGGGWLSSYTGEPLSREEMDEYGDNILKKLSPLIHKEMRILEIGCASGISMYRLAPQAGFYFGTDLSEVIIQKNRQQVKEKGYNNIQLACLPAHEIDRIDEKDFDLIIINSVIQCFPGHNHLRMIIRKCLDLLGEQGYLFIGDVMDQERKEALVQDLRAFKQADAGKKYKTKTDFSQELFVSPGFFRDLRGQFPVIREVEITGKIGTIENELSKFRFDALLQIDKHHEAGAQPEPVEILKHQQDLSALEAHGNSAPMTNATADQLAYVIFTSGTTGIPKGVMVEHKGLANLCYWHNRYYEVTADDNATLYAGFGFDASVWELFPYMLTGASVHVIPTEIRLDIDALNRYFDDNNITVSFLPTQLCEQFMEKDNRSLRLVLTGGDKLRIFKENRYRLFNNYGPTENAVVTTACEITAFSDNIPIGPPIHNNRVYILHKDTLELQPLGVPGELCIAGNSLARGYLNDRELTRKKFIDNPHVPGERIYRTGDLTRWLPDGNIQFLGRVDYQVKIRGYRIELGEIETRLLAHEQVKEACVLDREDNAGLKYLCAYIVPTAPGDWDENRFIMHLAGELPEYMIPAHFIKMEEFPYNLSGKIDRASLPAPDVGMTGDYVAPTNDIEAQLTKIWSDILGIPVESIGITIDFFQVGGHSLKATNLVSRIHQAFDVKIPLSEIFKTPTIRELGEYIGNSAIDAYVAIEPADGKEHYVLSSPQKRLYVLQQMEPDSAAYNIPLFLSLEGDIDLDKLETTFKKLIQRHESLRTSFHMLDGIPFQKIADQVEFAVQYREGWNHNILTDFVKPFDLEKAPLVRVGLVRKAEKSFILMVDMHHLITDGTSGKILQNEFFSLYNGRELPPLKLQYKDFSVWQEGPEYRELIHRQESYWLDKLDGSLPVLSLPQDFTRPETQGFTGNSVTFHVEKDQHTAMRQLAEKHGVTLYSLFLSLYNVLLSKLSHQEDILVGTAVAGRRHRDLEKVIGMFVNTIVLRNYPEPGKSFNRFLEEIKTSTLEAFEHQEYPFEDLVEKIGQGRDTGRNPLFDVMFNYIHRNMSAGSVESEPGSYKSSYFDYENKTAKFDMTLGVWEAEDSFICSLEYRTDLFNEETIKRFVEYFKFILETVLDDPTVTLENIVLKSDLATTSSTITQDIEEDFEF